MRMRNLILWDIRFQARYGFYLLYGFLTLLYLVLLLSLPQSWKTNAAAVLIFSDPAAMGLFFMGAIVLLEKSQRVNPAFAVSPLKAIEYVISKVVSLGMIALLVAAVLTWPVNRSALPGILLGTAISSVLFTLLGMIIAVKITSLNQFILATIPFEIIIFIPAVVHLSGNTNAVMKIYPANVCMDLIAGRTFSRTGLLITIVLIFLLTFTAYKCVLKMWQSEGGVKL